MRRYLRWVASVLIQLAVVAEAAPLPGQVVVHPQYPQWLARQGGGPFFLCAPGDPEGFLYRGTQNANGTRSGDQTTLINKLKGTGANAIYLMAVRSHGGDGGASENPFVGNDPTQGLNQAVLNQWETWFAAMDQAGIVVFFIFYDDSARIWNTGDNVGAAEKAFVQGLVNKFEHHKNLIWVVAEEYQERYSAKRVSNIAAEIRTADDHDHPIAVHKLSGIDFSEFANDQNIDQFAIQYNVSSPAQLHSGMVQAWQKAAGKYNLNMSEAANHGTGATARRKNWAAAIGGAYVMVLGWDIAGTAVKDLQECGYLVKFMESTSFFEMAPNDQLKHGGTDYVLALPGKSYIAYAVNLSGNLGLKGMTAGTYDLTWFDAVTGKTVNQGAVSVATGDQTWTKPASMGNELALYLAKTGGSSNAPPTATPQQVAVTTGTTLAITLSHTDPDGPGPYSYVVSSPPTQGALSGSGAQRTYTPKAGYLGGDAFSFTVNDGLATSQPGQISITVTAAGNAPPAVSDQSHNTGPSQPVNIQLKYTDPDGPGPYTVTIVTPPTGGVLSGTGNDRVYTPDTGFLGTDSLQWKVSDGIADSQVATVTIEVSSSPPADGGTVVDSGADGNSSTGDASPDSVDDGCSCEMGTTRRRTAAGGLSLLLLLMFLVYRRATRVTRSRAPCNRR